MNDDGLRDVVLEAARRIGFHRVALVPVEAPRRHELYRSWLERGYHGEMSYLAEPSHVEPRAEVTRLLSGARTLVVVALAYARDLPRHALPVLGDDLSLRGTIARYARGGDYHLVLRDKLVLLADAISAAIGRPVASRACVDAAPILEREWAERGGLGFVAKNTMLIAPGLGSYVLLGELVLDVDLAAAPAPPPRPRCGSCRACLDACPTRAFADAYVLDARRCISYLTIEHRGAMPRELRALVGTWIFGCDICQEVCPFNAGAERDAAPELAARDLEHALPDLIALAFRNTNQLRQFVKRTALRRAGRAQLLRNVAVALGNTGDARAVPAAVHLLRHSAALVRGHAAWALARLATAGAGASDGPAGHQKTADAAVAADIAAHLAAAGATEPDADARDEIDRALAEVRAARGWAAGDNDGAPRRLPAALP